MVAPPRPSQQQPAPLTDVDNVDVTGDLPLGVTQSLHVYLFRQNLYRLLDEPTSSNSAMLVSYFIFATIIVSVATFNIGSYPFDLCEWRDEYTPDATRVCSEKRLEELSDIKTIETVCIMIFSVEYAIKLCTASTVMPLGRWFCEPLNLLDLVAIMPWYYTQIMAQIMDPDKEGGPAAMFTVFRIVRLTRVLRVVKGAKSMKEMVVLFRTLHRSLPILTLLFFLVGVMMLSFGIFASLFERGTYNEHTEQYLAESGDPSMIFSIVDAMYWCMASMTTVGYGDIYPITVPGKLVGIFTMLAGIVILSLPITLIGANFSEEYIELQRIASKERRLAQHNARLAAEGGDSDGGRGSRILTLMRRRSSTDMLSEGGGGGGASDAQGDGAGGADASADASADGDADGGGGSSSSSSSAGVQGSQTKGRLSAKARGGLNKMKTAKLIVGASTRMKTSSTVLTATASFCGTSTGSLREPQRVLIPGYVECEWLLDDYRSMVVNDFKAMLQKGEADLMRMARKVIIHSRVVAPGRNREGEEGPGSAEEMPQMQSVDPNWSPRRGSIESELGVAAEPNRRVRRLQ